MCSVRRIEYAHQLSLFGRASQGNMAYLGEGERDLEKTMRFVAGCRLLYNISASSTFNDEMTVLEQLYELMNVILHSYKSVLSYIYMVVFRSTCKRGHRYICRCAMVGQCSQRDYWSLVPVTLIRSDGLTRYPLSNNPTFRLASSGMFCCTTAQSMIFHHSSKYCLLPRSP